MPFITTFEDRNSSVALKQFQIGGCESIHVSPLKLFEDAGDGFA
jgi:hypothetical protein